MKLRRNLKNSVNAATPVMAACMVLLVVSSTVGTIVVVGIPYVESLEDNKNRQFMEQQWDSVADSINDLISSNPGEGETYNINPNMAGSVSIDKNAKDKTVISYAFDHDYDFSVISANKTEIQLDMKNGGYSFNSADIFWFDFKDNCFLAGTKVVMADESYKNIENIVVGDLVLAYDENSGTLTNCKVDHTFHHTPEEMNGYYLIINDNLKVTPNHRFYSDGEWVHADNLQTGDYLLTKELENYVISSIEKVYEKVPAYDLEIEYCHTFFVSMNHDIDVLVHNPTIARTIEFFINGNGIIIFDGTPYNNGESGKYLDGEYSVYATPASRNKFVDWSVFNGVVIEYPTSPIITATVMGNGGLTANFEESGSATISFRTDPVDKGKDVFIFDGITRSGGDNLYADTGTFECSVTPPSGYAFEGWTRTNGVYVIDPDSETTDIIFNSQGELKAWFNGIPVANPDNNYLVPEGGTINAVAGSEPPGVLDNDIDPDEDPLTAILVSGPSQGNLNLNSDGSFTYTHNPGGGEGGDIGGGGGSTDTFTYKANDSKDEDLTTVTITIGPANMPPVANDDYYTMYPDATLVVSAPGVLDNDVDEDHSTLEAAIDGDPKNGHLEAFFLNGGFTYIPNTGFTGIDSFLYVAIDDEKQISEPAFVNITVNNPPETPAISGQDPPKLEIEKLYDFNASTTDPDGHELYYWFDWGDDTNSGWLGPAPSGDIFTDSHLWKDNGSYSVKVKAKDIYGSETAWSNVLTMKVGPVLAVSTTHLNFELKAESGDITKSFYVLNEGIGEIKDIIIKEAEGVSPKLIKLINPDQTDVSQSDVKIDVTFNTNGLEPGRYASTILIDAGEHGEKMVSVKLSIYETHSGSTSSSEGVAINNNKIKATDLPFEGTVVIDLLGASGDHVGIIWLFDSNSIEFEASSSSSVETKLIIEHGGVISVASNAEYVHTGPRIMNNEQILSLSIVQTVILASNSGSSFTGELCKLKANLLGSATDSYDLKKSSIYGFRIKFNSDYTSAWDVFFLDHDFIQEELTDDSITLRYNYDGIILNLWHSYIGVFLEV